MFCQALAGYQVIHLQLWRRKEQDQQTMPTSRPTLRGRLWKTPRRVR